jgi:mycofactocin precursor
MPAGRRTAVPDLRRLPHPFRRLAMNDNQISAEPDIAVDEVIEEVLVEEVSIDGMCGVY